MTDKDKFDELVEKMKIVARDKTLDKETLLKKMEEMESELLKMDNLDERSRAVHEYWVKKIKEQK